MEKKMWVVSLAFLMIVSAWNLYAFVSPGVQVLSYEGSEPLFGPGYEDGEMGPFVPSDGESCWEKNKPSQNFQMPPWDVSTSGGKEACQKAAADALGKCNGCCEGVNGYLEGEGPEGEFNPTEQNRVNECQKECEAQSNSYLKANDCEPEEKVDRPLDGKKILKGMADLDLF